ncbi:hypothetical protein WMF26_31905 [Sorangium sp. So ce185]|uniref:hypothetical protein n=1 Tax=Sorangium sp. So ce185 TaxID=3133287 RepID=UPI003F623F45
MLHPPEGGVNGDLGYDTSLLFLFRRVERSGGRRWIGAPASGHGAASGHRLTSTTSPRRGKGTAAEEPAAMPLAVGIFMAEIDILGLLEPFLAG